MNEVVKRRLAGATVLIGIAFVGVSLLPRIGSAPGEEGVRIVVIDLGTPDSPEPIAAVETVPPQLAAPEPDETAIAAVEPEPEPAQESAEIEDPGTPPGVPVATVAPTPSEAVSAAATPITAAPAARPIVGAELPAPAPVRPGLKLSEAITPVPKPAPATPAQARPEIASAPSAGTRWFVQVGGFADIRNAHQVQERLKGAGQASIIAPAETERGTLYRVRAGPYASRDAAAAAQTQLAGAGFASSSIVEP